MSVIHTPKEPELDARNLLFPVALGTLFLILILRLWYLQVVKGPELAEEAAVYGVTTVETLAPRGIVRDRTGKLLAGVHSQFVLSGVPAVVDKNPQVLDRLADITGARREKLQDAIAAGRWRRHFPAPLIVGLPVEQAILISESADDLPGISVQSQPMRYYVDLYAFSHVLGYVWTPNDRDEERLQSQGVKIAPYVGKSGLEAFYERELVGNPGVDRYEINAKRVPIRLAERVAAEPGNEIDLTLDARLHKYAMQLLRGKKGAVVAVEPSTGEVLCMASSPSFNVGPFMRGIRQDEFDALRNDQAHPLINRAFDVNASYSPGSTFKPVTTIAAIRAGVFDPKRTVFCPGYYQLGTRKIRCLGRHGAVSFRSALVHSCNTYFADLALRAGERELRRAALDCGLGQKSGIDLRGEGSGIVPTEEFIKKWRADGKWYAGDTVNMGIGQGELATTPLQMADLAALLANRGKLMAPHLARRVGETMIEPRELHEVSLPDATWNALFDAMAGVIEEGTAKVARIPGIKWAGKTGSAEKRGQNRTNSWFIGFAPLDNPRIAICVLGEGVGHGSEFAAPIAKAVVERYLQEIGILAASASALESSTSASSNQR